MIRRFTSAQFVPANAGAKVKNPVGSTLFSTPMVALLRHPGHKILRTSCHESARKRLKTAAQNAPGRARRISLIRLSALFKKLERLRSHAIRTSREPRRVGGPATLLRR